MLQTIFDLWGKNPSVVIASIALLVSIASLSLGALNLGWSIYKEFMQGGRMRVSLMNALLVFQQDGPHPKRLSISITNFGPKKTRACILQIRKTSWWRKMLRREIYAMLNTDYVDVFTGKLPTDLEVGQKVDLTFRYLPNLFLNEDFNQLGVSDPFGKTHWCARANYQDIRKRYLEKKSEYETKDGP